MSSLLQQVKENKESKYLKYRGGKTHKDIAKELGVSTSLSHKIENDVMLKFALALFNPPWQVREPTLCALKNACGHPVVFQEVGECFEALADAVLDETGDNKYLFKKEYEKRIVETSHNVYFKRFVFSLFRDEEDDVQMLELISEAG